MIAIIVFFENFKLAIKTVQAIINSDFDQLHWKIFFFDSHSVNEALKRFSMIS